VDTLVPDQVATRLLTALRRALAAVASGVSRLEITIDVTTPLPDGRDAVRLRVYEDGGTTVSWRSPL
jgi:hypothetical protein